MRTHGRRVWRVEYPRSAAVATFGKVSALLEPGARHRLDNSLAFPVMGAVVDVIERPVRMNGEGAGVSRSSAAAAMCAEHLQLRPVARPVEDQRDDAATWHFHHWSYWKRPGFDPSPC